MTYKELRELWFDFYRKRGHAIVPSASVVPENDPSTLFVTAGMQPLVPFLLGEKHPQGKRIANIQRCIRTGDIDEVGDDSHLTFFEMMGNWSLGDYFKKEKVGWSYELLTKHLGIDPLKLHVTIFAGDKDAPRDKECAELWEQNGIGAERIHAFDKGENWWAMSSGLGPQGPCSEMFYHDKVRCKCKNCKCNPAENCGCFTELGNDVYMQFVAEKVGELKPSPQKNVDTGWGLERILCFVNGHKSVYETELFAPAIEMLGGDKREARIIAEHTRASCAIIADGVNPSNTGAGYVLRRLIRRVVRNANKLKIGNGIYGKLISFYNSYLEFDARAVEKVFMAEVEKFEKTIAKGMKEFESVAYVTEKNFKSKVIDGKAAFYLYETYGFPIELTAEMAAEKGLTIDMAAYKTASEGHAQMSREAGAAAGAFKGGLADTGVETVKLHTVAHILLAVLRKKFGEGVVQRGSNITAERLRYDFAFGRRLEPNELTEVENAVNEIIAKNLDVKFVEMPVKEAMESGAVGTFGARYGDVVKVYTIGDAKNPASREICGGPHVGNTRELGVFKIQKEESVGAGVRRIKAILQ